MLLNLQAAINDARIGGAAGIIKLANQARPSSSYLLATILPERKLASYQANSGSMIVRATMAGAVGMDSKFPEGGVVDLQTFVEQIAKLAIQANLSEQQIREIQEFAKTILLSGGDTTDLAINTVLNFVDKLLMQPHFDRTEWLRGQALFTGGIDWSFNGSNVEVSYGIPAANIFPTRTSTAGYGGSASVFWSDMRAMRRIHGAAYQTSIASRRTIEEIIYNDVNAINVLGNDGGQYRIQRYRGSLERPSTDARDTMTLVEYDAEGEVLDAANPGRTIKVPFIPDGVVGHFARSDRSRQFIVGEGSTEDPENSLELGYTHVGPTTENHGTPGRWARVYTPEDMPMQLRGQATANVLPVVTNPDKIVLTSTAFQA